MSDPWGALHLPGISLFGRLFRQKMPNTRNGSCKIETALIILIEEYPWSFVDERKKELERLHLADPENRDILVELGALYDRTAWTYKGKTIREWTDQLQAPWQEAWQAAVILKELGALAGQAVPALCLALSHDYGSVALAAAEALESIGLPYKTVITALLKALHTNDTGLRAALAKALAELGSMDNRVVPALTQALSNKTSIFVQRVVVQALIDLGEPPASFKKYH